MDERAAHVRKVSRALAEDAFQTVGDMISQIGMNATFTIPAVLTEREEYLSYNGGPDDEFVTLPTDVDAKGLYTKLVDRCLRWSTDVESWHENAKVVDPLTALSSASDGILAEGDALAALAGEISTTIDEANALRSESGITYQAAHRPAVAGRKANLFLDAKETT